MSSWKANCSRWSVTISRAAVIGSPVVGVGAARAPRRACPGSYLIPSQIIGITGPSVNEGLLGPSPRSECATIERMEFEQILDAAEHAFEVAGVAILLTGGVISLVVYARDVSR